MTSPIPPPQPKSVPPPSLDGKEIKRAIVVSSPYKPEGQDVARAIVTWLERAGVEVVEDIEGTLDLATVADSTDIAISVGGDGTMLSTSRRLRDGQVPTLGVNLGKLGFLAEFSETEVREWIAGRRALPLVVTPRMRLKCTVWANGEETSQFALNDAVVNQGLKSRLITINMSVDDHHAIQYRADGLLVSTPVGSTAYSLSLGGPILAPGLGAFIVTPIAPHALTNRPIAVAGESKLRFRMASPVDEAALVLDGHETLPLSENTIFQIQRAESDFLLVSSAKRSYYYLLRNKLGWGKNPTWRAHKVPDPGEDDDRDQEG